MIKFFYQLAKTWLGGILLHWIFSYFSFVIPGDLLIETESILAFHHPSPAYSLHILIVPREKKESLKDLPSENGSFEVELFEAVKELVERFDLDEKGYRIIANGGEYQEVQHLHFHLISE